MPTIGYLAEGFPAPFDGLNGYRDIELSWAFLAWSAITVGRRELIHVVRHGRFSMFEIAYRLAILYANLRENGIGRLERSEAYDGLDPSEKSAISYFLGLTLTKAFAESRLGVPWLMHLDVYRDELRAVLLSGGRPDLVGHTATGDWAVLESKGRTHGPDRQTLARAKGQAQMLATVDGQAPLMRVGVVTHFGGGSLQLAISDPPEGPSDILPPGGEGGLIRLPLTRQRLLEGYYRPFRSLLSEEASVEIRVAGAVYRAVSIDSADASVGLLRQVLDQQPAAVEALRVQVPEMADYYAGSDGVLVKQGSVWSSENMTREPQERHRPEQA